MNQFLRDRTEFFLWTQSDTTNSTYVLFLSFSKCNNKNRVFQTTYAPNAFINNVLATLIARFLITILFSFTVQIIHKIFIGFCVNIAYIGSILQIAEWITSHTKINNHWYIAYSLGEYFIIIIDHGHVHCIFTPNSTTTNIFFLLCLNELICLLFMFICVFCVTLLKIIEASTADYIKWCFIMKRKCSLRILLMLSRSLGLYQTSKTR